MLKPEIEPSIVIYTVPHKPWQEQNLRLPKVMPEIATKTSLPANPRTLPGSHYFLVRKKDPGDYRFINDMQPLNKVMIRDAGMPPTVDECSRDVPDSYIDCYSGYNQLSLEQGSRDLTSFVTDAGLVRQTRLPQGWTDSVAVFQ